MLAWVLGGAAVGMIVKAFRIEAERRAREERLLRDLRTLRDVVEADCDERRAA